MKKFAAFIIILIFAILIGLWAPWRGININLSGLFGIATQEELSGLQVNSLSGTLQIYVDNELKGEVTPETSPYFVDKITPGEHLLKIVRKSDVPAAYWVFNKLVPFEANTNVVVSYNIGTGETFSEGHIIYATKKEDPQKDTVLNVITNVEGFSIQFDSLLAEKVSFREYTTNLDLSRQHSIKLLKSNYETLDFVILPSSQEDRDKLKEYDLTVESQMMFQPVSVEDIII